MSFQGDSIFWVEVEKIVPNPYQPRREFDESRLKELAESVRMYGILQPLTVTRKEVLNTDGSFRSEYELIAGERRLRASRLAGLTQVPVIIRDGEQTEQEKLELAIIENLQREDLNAVDRALAFRQLADVFGLSHTQVAKKVGRSREYVSNTVRLLALPDYMLSSLRLGDISEGHARTLLMLNDRPEEQDTVFREILMKKLSVREVERIARGIAIEKVRKKENVDVEIVELERKFTETLGTRVSIVKTDYGGKLTIDYFSQDDLEQMLMRMRDEAKLPKEGSGREEMELQADRETKQALEKLTESTGLTSMPSIEAKTEIETETSPTVALAKNDEQEQDLIVPPTKALLVDPELEIITVPVDQSEIISKPLTEIKTASPTTASPIDNPLRAQLAILLGNKVPMETKSPTVKTETPTVTPVSTPLMEAKPQSEISTPNPTPIPVPTQTPTPDSDDSDLYSINKFSI